MLLDIHGERLDLMNAHNVEHFVLVTSPFRPFGPLLQGLPVHGPLCLAAFHQIEMIGLMV
jgi:hypothetical protein